MPDTFLKVCIHNNPRKTVILWHMDCSSLDFC